MPEQKAKALLQPTGDSVAIFNVCASGVRFESVLFYFSFVKNIAPHLVFIGKS